MNTSAFVLLCMLFGRPGEAFTPVAVPFDRVMETVSSGEVDAGVVIHEGQIMFESAGLELVADLGQVWRDRTSMAVPLGANAVRRDLDERCGPGSLVEIVRLLKASLDYALAHRVESLAYAKTFSPLKDDADLDRYVRMYVNGLTVDARPRGLTAVQRLIQEATALGICPQVGPIEMAGA